MNLLDFDDPIWMEPKMKTKRFFCFGNARLKAILALTGTFYLAFLGIVALNVEFVEPSVIITFQTVLICIVSITVTHGTIAGEREKRSWETLLTAPITNAQIVGSKLLSGFGACLIIIGLFLIPTLMTQFGNKQQVPIGATITHELSSVAFSMFLISLGVFVSSKSKRAFASQLLLYVLLFVGLMVLPAVAGAFGPYNMLAETVYKLNPMIGPYMKDENFHSQFVKSINPTICYLVTSAVLIFITVKTLSTEDANHRKDGGMRTIA